MKSLYYKFLKKFKNEVVVVINKIILFGYFMVMMKWILILSKVINLDYLENNEVCLDFLDVFYKVFDDIWI